MYCKDVTNLELWRMEILERELTMAGKVPIGCKTKEGRVLYLYDDVSIVEMGEA